MIFETTTWLLVVEILSFISFPICWKLFSRFSDRGYGASKLVGISLVGYVSWLFGFAFGFSRLVIFISVVIIASVSGIFFFKSKKDISKFVKSSCKNILQTEALFIFLFLFFLLLRAQVPAMDSLEKFMDAGFLNSMIRSTSMPPTDPWLSGGSINYYYFGHLIAAALAKISSIPGNIAYNLAFATWYAIFSLLVYLLILEIAKKRRYAVLAIVIVCVVGNFFGVIQLVTFASPQSAQPIADSLDLNYSINCCRSANSGFWENLKDFQLWPSTRIVPGAINEFPSATFLFGDLHAHFMGFAFQVFIFMILLEAMRRKRISIEIMVALGIFLGMAGAVSSWIYFIASLTVVLAFAQKEKLQTALSKLLVVLALSFVFIAPFFLSLSHIPSQLTLVSERTPIFHIILIFGLPLFVIYWHILQKREFRKKFAISLIISGILSLLLSIPSLLLLLPVLFWCWSSRNDKDEKKIFAIVLIAAATIALISTDIVCIDNVAGSRFNAVFKTYLMSWISYGLAASIIVSSMRKSRLFISIFVVLVAASLIIPFFVVMNFVSQNDIKGIDGTAYILASRPGDYYAIQWLNENVNGSPVILESPGRAYTYDSRISANTGLPAVIGWVNHEFVWRGIWFTERENDADEIYQTLNTSRAIDLLKKYDVTYVYVGSVEMNKYDMWGLAKFGSDPRFVPVYSNGSYIYRVNYVA